MNLLPDVLKIYSSVAIISQHIKELIALFLVSVAILYLHLQDKKSKCKSSDCGRCYSRKIRDKAKHLTNVYNKSVPNRIKESILHSCKNYDFLLYVNGLTSKRVWAISDLPACYQADVKRLKQNARVFLTEYENLFTTHKQQFKNDWTKHYFFNQGTKHPKTIELCPKTHLAITACANVIEGCLFSYSFFSTLAPGTVITPHCGSTNARLRCHIPLIVPQIECEDSCKMIVGGERVVWENDKAVVFDDSFTHSVEYRTHDCKENRVVLLIDFWHPDLSKEERSYIQQCFPLL